MQSRNQILDDFARLVTNALGLAQNASTEIDNAVKSLLDRYLTEQGLVTREEFDASQLMLKKAIAEIADLKKNLGKVQKQQKLKTAQNDSKTLSDNGKPSLDKNPDG